MSFRTEIREWLDSNCPDSCRGPGDVPGGGTKSPMTDDQRLWLDRCAEEGLTVPNWETKYGGAGFSKDQWVVMLEEMRDLNIRSPVAGMGVSMLGPTLLEFGSEEQKLRHLPRIARGEVWWCQGYSEPGSGSDLASLQTRAENRGDHYVINGQKIWTSGANFADWIFCLVRTNPDVPKHEGISFILFSMNQPGVTVRPIRLISGASPFCETFFDDAIANRDDLVSNENEGWTVAKRLLQHERSGILSLASGGNREAGIDLPRLESLYAENTNPALHQRILKNLIDTECMNLTQRRTVEESEGNTPGPATSIFKYYGATLAKERSELQISLMGTQGLGNESGPYSSSELTMTRTWLAGKARSIAGGSNEVQLNIIAKRVLGLPD
ncbi:MAG: acyl-CoA dehydrogenase family protein [Gammaproteobacteria bacterium]|nr:acyl-CoA dehydrogenase family protein [Gammaproteobacteria bacterium]